MTNHEIDTHQYSLLEELPSPESFVALREANEMTPRPAAGVADGIQNSLYGVMVRHNPSDQAVGMGRVIGDTGMVFQISDMVVHPEHQRCGLGTWIGEHLLSYIDDSAPSGTEINLFADVDGFYESLGFDETRPASKGMVQFVTE